MDSPQNFLSYVCISQEYLLILVKSSMYFVNTMQYLMHNKCEFKFVLFLILNNLSGQILEKHFLIFNPFYILDFYTVIL